MPRRGGEVAGSDCVVGVALTRFSFADSQRRCRRWFDRSRAGAPAARSLRVQRIDRGRDDDPRTLVGVTALHTVRAGLVDYEQAWQRQRELHAGVVAGREPDTVLLLEHPPVYTAGRRTEAWERPVDGTAV